MQTTRMLSRFGQSDGRGCVISRLLDNHLPSPCLNFQSTSSSSKSTGYTLISISFPDDFYRLSLDPTKPQLTDDQRATLKANIQLLRDAIVLFTATGAARGVGGHTGELSFVVSSKSISTIFLRQAAHMTQCPKFAFFWPSSSTRISSTLLSLTKLVCSSDISSDPQLINMIRSPSCDAIHPFRS